MVNKSKQLDRKFLRPLRLIVLLPNRSALGKEEHYGNHAMNVELKGLIIRNELKFVPPLPPDKLSHSREW